MGFSQTSPSIFNQNVLRQSQQAQAVQPAPSRPAAIRRRPQPVQPVQRRPQPVQPVQQRPQPSQVRPQQPQVVRQPPQQPQVVRQPPQQPQQPAAPVQRRPQPQAPVRTNIFPTFELPDFFTIPFAAFRSLEQPRSTAAAGSVAGKGLPAGQLQGQRSPTNLNILSGSYSYQVGVGR